MERLALRGALITRGSSITGFQQHAITTTSSDSDVNMNFAMRRGFSSAAASTSSGESFENLALSSSPCQSPHQTASSQSEFRQSSIMGGSRQSGMGCRSSMFRAIRPSEVNTGKISPTVMDGLEFWHHLRGSGKRRMSLLECRAAASDMGMIRDHPAFDLSAVPFLELLCSERAKVLILMAFGMALCNAVRVVMSVAILPMAAKFGWSTSFGGIVQSSFLWGYLLSPIPGGMLADRYGGKVVMAWGVAGWSLATLATPWAAGHSMGMLLTMRALMGLAEGVAMPSMNNILSKWFPRWERARAVGLTMAGFHLGSVAALLVSPGLLKNYGCAGPFWIFGTLGFLWLSIWCPCISKDPDSSPNVTSSEFSYIFRGQDRLLASPSKQSVGSKKNGTALLPLDVIFSKLPTWAIICANSMNNWGYFILLSWMPVYFNTVLGVNLREAAWFSAAPWAVMAGVGLVAGACSDYLIKAGISITVVRKITQSVGFLGPAAALLQLNAVTDPTVASLWLTAALGLSAFSQAGFLVNHQEIAPRYAGFLHGVSNSAGTLAAIISTVGTGFFIERLGSFQAILTLTSIMYIISTLFWNCHASGERVIA